MSAQSQTKYFNQTPSVSHPRSSFDRSKGVKTTFDAGWLIPIFCDQMIPGDTLNLDFEGMARLATPIKPTMDNLYLETFWFFVPRRLTWTNFQRYMGEQDNPTDSIDYLIPQIGTPDGGGGIAVMSLFDYLDIIPGVENINWRNDIGRSYNLIWNKWFRDENLQTSAVVDMDDGPDTLTDYVLLRRGKRKDYFTSCQLTPQKGPTVLIPGSDYLPVHGIGKNTANYLTGAVTPRESDGTSASYASSAIIDNSTTDYRFFVEQGATGTKGTTGYPAIHVDMTENTDGTMNALRMAEAMQVFYERQMRGGSRYIEQNKYQFGVTSPDARLQRPEFLGGGSTRVNITPTTQTNNTGATGTPQGNLAGVGIANVRNHGFTRSFTEHGIVLGLMSVRADLNYQNAMQRWYQIRSRDEEYFPPFANLGEQAVMLTEIYQNAFDSGGAETVWGYQERFAEYKQAFSTITGLFRSNVSGSLDVWHYAIDFDSAPTLGSSFIEDNPPIDRTIAVPSEPHFLFDSFLRINHVRPIPAHSAPRLGVL